jgi:hypothetical protein
VPDLWFWLLLGVVNAGLVAVVWREAWKRALAHHAEILREARGKAFAEGRAYEKERNENIAAATEADRKATIRKNRSEGSRKAWETRKNGAGLLPPAPRDGRDG